MPGFFERVGFGFRHNTASCRPFRHKRRGHALTCSAIECLEERVALAGFDVEPNNTWSEASPIGLTVNMPGSVTGSGTLSPVNPVDRIDSYWFTVGIGATVSVTLKVPDSNMFTIYRLESGGRIADSLGNGSELTLNLQYSVTPQPGNPNIKAVTVSTPLDFSDSVSTYELTVTTDGGQSIATDIEAISLERDEPSNDIIFTYNIKGEDLPPLSSPFIALYWATGTSFDSIVEPTAALTPTFATTVGTYQRRFSASLFENPPAEASYLLAVVDPPLNSQPHVGAITEVNEDNNIIALRINDEPQPQIDIELINATAQDPNSFIIHYNVMGNSLESPFRAGIYRSPSKQFSSSDADLVMELELPRNNDTGGLSFQEGQHYVRFDTDQNITFNKEKPYFHIMIDIHFNGSNRAIVEPNTANNVRQIGLVSVDELIRVNTINENGVTYSLSRSDAERFIDPLNEAMAEYGIFTYKRQAAFLAQMAEESRRLEDWEENASRRYPNFENYETGSRRTQLGNHQPGDGMRFRGRGPMQLTGRYNYTFFGNEIGINLVDNPDLLADRSNPSLGFRSAAWFWTHEVFLDRDSAGNARVFAGPRRGNRNLNNIADSVDFNNNVSISQINEKVTRIINGGTNGIAKRKIFYLNARDALSWWQR